MGVLVNDAFELESGVSVTGVYVRLREVDIINNANSSGDYQLVGTFDYYANQKARDEEKEILKQEYISIGSTTLDRVHDKLYAKFKSDLTSFEDVN